MNRRKTPRTRAVRGQFEQLEGRQMMATFANLSFPALEPAPASPYLTAQSAASLSAGGISAASTAPPTAVLEGGYLKITGNNDSQYRDSIVIRPAATLGKIDVSLRLADQQGNILSDQVLTFSTFSMPYGIRFEGRAGHDLFANLTAVKLYANGGQGDDTIFGGSGDDHLIGGDGNDTLVGREGHDRLEGGSGEDTLFGDGGNDTLLGGTMNDIIYGGAGNDFLDGGYGNDVLKGESGDDTLWGGYDNDQLWGGAGNDRLRGDQGNDELWGDDLSRIQSGGGNDVLEGGDGHDRLHGHSGNDLLYGGRGNDYLHGGVGNDRLWGDDGDDYLSGDEGDDWLDGGYDSYRDRLLGGAGNDTFVTHKTLLGGPGGGPEYHLDRPENNETDWHW